MTELGQRLKEAREEKNLSLDELQEMTKIQKRYLLAIENGEYEKLPGQFYARAFIKNYAEAVGLNPEELFETYTTDVPHFDDAVPDTLSRQQKKEDVTVKTTSWMNYLPKIAAALLIVGVLVVIWVVMQKNATPDQAKPATNDTKAVEVEQGKKQKEDTTKEKKDVNVQKEDKTAKKDKEEKQTSGTLQKTKTMGSTTYYELTGAKSLKVDMKLTGDSWIDIKNGLGKTIVGKAYKKGETISEDLTNEEEIRLNIGYAPSVELKVNGEKVDLSGGVPHQFVQVKQIKNNNSTDTNKQ